jgi:hypothetical protein
LHPNPRSKPIKLVSCIQIQDQNPSNLFLESIYRFALSL